MKLNLLSMSPFTSELIATLKTGTVLHRRRRQFAEDFLASLEAPSAGPIERHAGCSKAIHAFIDDSFFGLFATKGSSEIHDNVFEIDLKEFVRACQELAACANLEDYARCLRMLERRCSRQSLLPELGVLFAMSLGATENKSFKLVGAAKKLLLDTFSDNQTIFRAARWTIGTLGQGIGDSPFRGRDVCINQQVQAFKLMSLLQPERDLAAPKGDDPTPCNATPSYDARAFSDFLLQAARLLR